MEGLGEVGQRRHALGNIRYLYENPVQVEINVIISEAQNSYSQRTNEIIASDVVLLGFRRFMRLSIQFDSGFYFSAIEIKHVATCAGLTAKLEAADLMTA